MAQENGHTVLVLGAGASVAEALKHRPKQQAQNPPLDATFFERVGKRRRHVTLMERVERHARKLGQRNLYQSGVSLEEYMGRLYFHVYHERSRENSDAYFDLVDLYANELVYTTRWMAGRRGVIKRLVERELDLGRKVSIATFNHDLLIENALETISTRRHGCVWCFPHVYPFPEEKPVVLTPGWPTFDTSCSGDADHHIPVYKLHGSLNWVFTTRGRHPAPSIMTTSAREFSILESRVGAEGKPTVKAGGGRRQYVSPLIVPPVYEKHGFIRNHLQVMWDKAADALKDASRVIFWGYSFPRADNHARYFFQGLAQENDALRKPVVINPDPEVAIETWSVLRPRRVAHYRDINEFLAMSR